MAATVTVVRALLTGLAFAGLCGLVKERLNIEGAFAPLVTSCGIIVALMVAGVFHVLFPGWLALCAAGFAGLIWRCLRKRAPDWTAVTVLAIAALYCLWHFRGAYYTGNDSPSHWGMVVKYMLRRNSFPDSSTRLIYFPSYPLGAGVFLYGLDMGIGSVEAGCMAGMLLLYVMSLMPVLAFVRRNRIPGWLLAGALSLYIIMYGGDLSNLQVDRLMGLMTFGGTAIIGYYADDPKRALPASALIAAALVFVKASGLFFAVLIAVMLLTAMRLNRLPKKALLRALLVMVLAIAAAFTLWNIHVKLAYPDAAHSKHALSVSRFATTMHEKTPGVIGQVLKGMVRRLFHPESGVRNTYLLCLLLFGILLALSRMAKDDRRGTWTRRFVALLITSAALYAAWYAMIFLMYIFSMPVNEAIQLAAIKRYETTALELILGWQMLYLAMLLCREDSVIDRRRERAGLCGLLAIVLGLFAGTGAGRSMAGKLIRRSPEKPAPYTGLLSLREREPIDEEKRYMIFVDNEDMLFYTAAYVTKYEFFSNDIVEICVHLDAAAADPDAYYAFSNIYMHDYELEQISDLEAFISDHLDDCDYLLVYSRDESFETALSRVLEHYTGKTRVLYAY